MTCIFRAATRKYEYRVHLATGTDTKPICGIRGRPTKKPAQWRYTKGPPTCKICQPHYTYLTQNPELL